MKRRNTHSLIALLFGVLALTLGALLTFDAGTASAQDSATSANGIEPIFVAGNPTCQDLGYLFGFKANSPSEQAPNGTFNLPNTVGGTVTVSVSGFEITWSSNIGIDAVMVKGSDGNLYIYDPPAEALGDSGLQPPLNNGGQQAAISHVLFCYDGGGVVSDGSIAITKTASAADVCNGSSVTFTVVVTNTSTNSNWTGLVRTRSKALSPPTWCSLQVRPKRFPTLMP